MCVQTLGMDRESKPSGGREENPMLILKAINSYLRRIEKESDRYAELELQEERKQLEYMRISAESLKEALEGGNITGVTKAYKELIFKVEKCKTGMQNTHDNETISTDPDENWMRRVNYLNSEALQQATMF
jgi:hypothetical protein